MTVEFIRLWEVRLIPQDKIIEALEAEIIKLKTQLSDTEEKYHKMRKKFDDLMIKMHGGGRK